MLVTIGISAVLFQMDDKVGRLRLSLYQSPLSLPNETIAQHIVSASPFFYGVQKFKYYIEGVRLPRNRPSSFEMAYGDKRPTGRLARWAMALQELSFDIVYRKAKRTFSLMHLARAPDQSDDDSIRTHDYRDIESKIRPQ